MTNSFSNNHHYRTPSIGNISNSSDDLIDPAIMVVGRGKSSSFDMRSNSNSNSNSFDEESKLWLLMQQQQQSATSAAAYHHNHHHHHHNHDPQYSQTSLMPHQFSSSYQDDYYGELNSRVVDQQHQHQRYLQQHKFGNGGGHGHEVQQLNSRSDLGLVGLDKLLPGYGDVYTRVFGM